MTRRSWLLAGLGIPLLGARDEESLVVTFDGDNIRLTAPGLHFLTGKPLQRLKDDAATVVFDSRISLFSDDHGTPFIGHRPVSERLIISYDLWAEKFSVTIRNDEQRHLNEDRGATLRTKLGLTAPQAEAFALNELAVSALGLAPDRPFWLRFELSARPPKQLSSVVGEAGISLNGLLIDLLSRKPGADNPYWTRSAGPLRLADLPRTPPARGPRG